MDKSSDSTNAAPAVHGAPVPAVSVVVPCFNGGRFLDGLLTSLARQTFRDFDIIIVDDGSDDEATLHKLASLEDQVRVIHQANGGLSAARNTGIRASASRLVLPLDCDDMIEPPFLAEAVALMNAAPVDVAAVFSHMRLNATGAAVWRNFNRFDLLFTNTMPSGLLFRKECWEAVGGYDESMRDGYEDWEFHLRLAHHGYRAIELPEPYYIYCIATDGMLLNRCSRLHGQLWRTIRRKHADLYGLPAVLRLWWKSRDGTGSISLGKGLGAYALAMVLPDTWFSRLIAAMRRRHLLHGH